MLTPKQAAARIGVSVSLIYQWCKEGLIEHLRLGAQGKRGKVMIDPESLERYVESCKQPSRAPVVALRHITASR